MIKLIVSTAAFASLTAAASAADLPRRALPPAPIPVPIFTWTGTYFGVNAGYITTTQDTVRTAGVFPGNDGVRIGNRPAALPLPQDGSPAAGSSATTISSPPARASWSASRPTRAIRT